MFSQNLCTSINLGPTVDAIVLAHAYLIHFFYEHDNMGGQHDVPLGNK